MSQKKTIAYVGNFSFPHGNASGTRVLGNGYLFRELGYEVIFIGLDNTLKSDSKIKETKNDYDGFTYYNLPYPIGKKGWLSYRLRFNEAISCLEEYTLFAVIGYGNPTLSLFNAKMHAWCSSKRIYYLTDCVDWLESSAGVSLYKIVKFLDYQYQKVILNSRADGVIAISTYLSAYYKDKNCKTVRIPPLVNPKRFSHLSLPSQRDGRTTRFIYVGTPFPTDGRIVKTDSYKDRLDKVIDALLLLEDTKIRFDIYGLTKEQYLAVISRHSEKLKNTDESICFHGFIKNEEVIDRIAQADFSILFRDVNRGTTAGFPTKFVESISCGTPMITTRTSDLALYLESGKNGFFVEGKDDASVAKELLAILHESNDRILSMKHYCLNSNVFAYSNFVPQVKTFFDSLT